MLVPRMPGDGSCRQWRMFKLWGWDEMTDRAHGVRRTWNVRSKRSDDVRVQNRVTGWSGTATLTADHAAASYGQPVVIVDGEPIGTGESWQFLLVECSDEERRALQEAGYSLQEAIRPAGEP